jgi:hypothetical protein
MSADGARVISSALRFVSIVSCLLVATSFVLFAHDQIAGASVHQVDALQVHPQARAVPSKLANKHGQPRQFIDASAKALDSPFVALVHSPNEWITHGFPAVCALLVYGVGLGYLARFARVVP